MEIQSHHATTDNEVDHLHICMTCIQRIRDKCTEIQEANQILETVQLPQSQHSPQIKAIQTKLTKGIKFNKTVCALLEKHNRRTHHVLQKASEREAQHKEEQDLALALARDFELRNTHTRHTDDAPTTDTARRGRRATTAAAAGPRTDMWRVTNRAQGACLFESLAYGIYGETTPENTLLLREQICEYMWTNRNTLMADGLTLETFVRDREKSFSAYLTKMREPHTFGGYVEIVILTHMMPHIIVKSYEYIMPMDQHTHTTLIQMTQEYTSPNRIQRDKIVVHILYSNRNHYEALTSTPTEEAEHLKVTL